MSLQKRILSHDYSNLEEIIHSITHGLGVPLGVVGLVFLILRAVITPCVWILRLVREFDANVQMHSMELLLRMVVLHVWKNRALV